MEKPKIPSMSRTAATIAAAAAIMPFATDSALADSAVQREIARRAALTADADAAIIAGRDAYAAGDYREAVNQYRRALDLLPNAPNTAARRAEYQEHLADASVMLSRLSVKQGDLAGAKALVDDVLVENPDNLIAKQEQQYLDDPIRTNQALTAEHGANVDAVRRHLYTAQGYYDLADFDGAEREYHKVLRIDKYNTAARRGLEQVHRAKSDYYRSAYDETRAHLLSMVDAGWETAVPSLVSSGEGFGGALGLITSNTAAINEKLDTIIVPEFNMTEFTVADGVQRLRQISYELDVNSTQDTRGIDFFVLTPSVGGAVDAELDAETLDGGNPNEKLIREIRLSNVPLRVILDKIVQEASLRYKVTDFLVEIVPLSSEQELVPRTFTVPANFRAFLSESGSGGGGDDGGGLFDDGDSGGGSLSIQDLLQQAGIAFPDGAKAALLGGTRLAVTNTPSNLDAIEALVNDALLQTPKMIKITTKFVEVAQENTDELGFDWLVQPFGVTPNTVFLGGGTVGNGAARGAADFIQRVNRTPINPGAAGGTSTTQNIVTSGLRNGDFAIAGNSIDAILNNPNRTAQTSNVAPGILSLTGIFTDGQVQMIMRGLQQRKGTDIMTAPSVMTRSSGEQATIEVVREFIYPTEYEPPELPNEVGIGGAFGGGLGVGGLGTQSQSAGIFPVTPATPTSFDVRKTGVTLSIEPTLGPDGYTVDLTFTPEIVEFEGFINYGAPIQSPGTDAFGNPAPVTITENRIEMPVFSSRRVQTSVTIYDGHTVAVGGLMREDVQMVRDQVPILGDVPLVGRLFKSESENRIKSNLIIFVTAEVIDPSGRKFLEVNQANSLGDGSVLPAL